MSNVDDLTAVPAIKVLIALVAISNFLCDVTLIYQAVITKIARFIKELTTGMDDVSKPYLY